ncbi:MAG TPA: 1-acyl-sn-glycerol-3-phosphate acyltransferase [Salinivirgaceae bacterium]|nr:1-acyl-sn-glycerol-3-phosphate acyltransferase [Salinivirgaceae bacterium]
MDPISLEQLFEEKNPALAKKMPRVAYWLLKRILHLKEINEFLLKNGDRSGIDSVRTLLSELNVSYTVHGLEKIKKNHRYQFAGNHPLGAFDGVTLLDVVYTHVGEPRFLVNDVLLELKIFDPFFVPINAYGSASKSNARLIDEAYASDKQILIFPSGMASRKIKGKITDLEWKKSFVQKSIEHQRDIVPFYFQGRNSSWFYNLSNWRKRLGIKANIEMLYLPSEMYKQAGNHYNIYFGDPIPWQDLKNTKSVREWVDEIRKRVYAMEP